MSDLRFHFINCQINALVQKYHSDKKATDFVFSDQEQLNAFVLESEELAASELIEFQRSLGLLLSDFKPGSQGYKQVDTALSSIAFFSQQGPEKQMFFPSFG